MNILIVDDNINAAESMMDLLIPEGHQVRLCEDGWSAVEAYRQGDFQLVFMDLKMPGMNGIEATRQILEHDANARIVVVTGNTVQEDLQTVADLGIVKVFRKPYDVRNLLSLVEEEGNQNRSAS